MHRAMRTYRQSGLANTSGYVLKLGWHISQAIVFSVFTTKLIPSTPIGETTRRPSELRDTARSRYSRVTLPSLVRDFEQDFTP